eukprot:359811-Chlamydomonas_euryale.AAC.3
MSPTLLTPSSVAGTLGAQAALGQSPTYSVGPHHVSHSSHPFLHRRYPVGAGSPGPVPTYSVGPHHVSHYFHPSLYCRYPGDAGSPGSDCAGVVVRHSTIRCTEGAPLPGDAVFGLATGCLASHVGVWAGNHVGPLGGAGGVRGVGHAGGVGW